MFKHCWGDLPRIGDEVVDRDLGSLPVPDVLETGEHQLVVESV